jgi:uncharacterized protein (DUF1697 family)
MAVFVVLLRAIGPATHKIMSMADWRDASTAAGFTDPQTYVATGNMIVESDLSLAKVAASMNRIVIDLGLKESNRAIVRKAATLKSILKANPYPSEPAKRASQIAVYFFDAAHPNFDWLNDYEGPEAIHVEGAHLIVDHGDTEGQSMRLPGIIEKRSGLVTARNLNTVRGLAERCAARGVKH